jgi:hypothetical protein
VSLALHLGLMLATLRYCATSRLRDLAVPLVVGGAGTLLAQDVVFAFPGVFLVLGIEAYQRQRSHSKWILLGAALVILSLGAQYALIWSRIPNDESTYWGNKYNVFHIDGNAPSYLRWSLDRWLETTQFSGDRRRFWSLVSVSNAGIGNLRTVDGLAWSLACFAGLGLLIQRRQLRPALLLVMPCFVLWAFNGLGLWPMGVFRTNLFLLGYTAALAAMAFDWSWPRRAHALSLLPAAVLVIIPLLLFERDWHARKRALGFDGNLLNALQTIVTLRHETPHSGRELILFGGICPQWEYYSRVHPDAQSVHRKLGGHFDTRCARPHDLPGIIQRATSTGMRVWTLVRRAPPAARLIEGPTGQDVEILTETRQGSLRLAAFRQRGAPSASADGAQSDSARLEGEGEGKRRRKRSSGPLRDP